MYRKWFDPDCPHFPRPDVRQGEHRVRQFPSVVEEVKGPQGVLWELGGVPRVVLTDNLSAAIHELKNSRGRAMNAIVQTLILRGSRDFESEDEYRKLVRGVVDRRNRLVRPKLEAERRQLRPLLPAPVPEYLNYRLRVRKWSTIRVANRTYSVPSRLIGMVVDVRLYSDQIEVYFRDHLEERMERLHGAGGAKIDYCHIIGSLVRKPGAFARYGCRKQMFPSPDLPPMVVPPAMLHRQGLGPGSRTRRPRASAACSPGSCGV